MWCRKLIGSSSRGIYKFINNNAFARAFAQHATTHTYKANITIILIGCIRTCIEQEKNIHLSWCNEFGFHAIFTPKSTENAELKKNCTIDSCSWVSLSLAATIFSLIPFVGRISIDLAFGNHIVL